MLSQFTENEYMATHLHINQYILMHLWTFVSTHVYIFWYFYLKENLFSLIHNWTFGLNIF